MTPLHLDPDRFADVVQGRAAWLPGELAHLEHCAECRLESAISMAAFRLGHEEAGSLDPEALAARVRRNLAAGGVAGPVVMPSRTGRRVWPLLLGLAAAATVALVVLLPPKPAGSVPVEQLAVLHELDDLSAAELEAVLETLPPAADAVVHPDEGGFAALSADMLERMLRTME
jgi:hypothetical protein